MNTFAYKFILFLIAILSKRLVHGFGLGSALHSIENKVLFQFISIFYRYEVHVSLKLSFDVQLNHASSAYRYHTLYSALEGKHTSSTKALNMKQVLIPHQSDPAQYAKILFSTMDPSESVLRWYISEFKDNHAVVEVVFFAEKSS